MTVDVLLFARARELAGSERIGVELPKGATVADLRRALGECRPELAEIVKRCAVAVDAEFADDALALAPGLDIALLPPVSGG
jgi:molybdopterin converting factor subunit 1